MFQGVETNDALSLQETDFRFYNYELGRFLQIDLFAEDAFDWTSYRFGFNNPISFNDPTGLWEETKDGRLVTKDKREIARLLNFLEIDSNPNIENIENFITQEISGEGGRLSDGTPLLTGITVVNGSPTNRSLLRTRNEIAFYQGTTDYIYNNDDYRKRNEIAGNPNTNWLAKQINRQETSGAFIPLTATNEINHAGSEVGARLSVYDSYRKMQGQVKGSSNGKMSALHKSRQIDARALRRNRSLTQRRGDQKLLNAGPPSPKQLAMRKMSFREFRKNFSHLYRGKHKGRGSYLKIMARDWRNINK